MKEEMWNKKEKRVDYVYDIQEHGGYPHFLIYDEKNGWRYVSAKHFEPFEPSGSF